MRPFLSPAIGRPLACVVFATMGALAWSGVASADCLDNAARYHGVDSMLLRSIAMHESGMNPSAINRSNADGSEDIGLMQINSMHLRRLARYGIDRGALLDGCTNAYVGAWILRENIDRYGLTWRAVGAYNASTPSKQLRYVNLINSQWQALQRAAFPK